MIPAGFVAVEGTERRTATALLHEVLPAGGGAVRGILKRLGPRARGEAWLRDRLVAEAALLERLGGRGVPRWVAAGQDAHGPWLVMEKVAGEPLAVQPGARPASGWIAGVARAAFEALAMLHEAGVVHADLSPANVIATPDGQRVTLIDLGLARWPGAPPLPGGAFRGTLAYAAPELARGEPVDARADLFALATTLLHVESGQAPRTEASEAAALLSAAERGVEAWADGAAAGLDTRTARALVRSCAFEAATRPASAREVRQAMTPGGPL